MKIRSGFVSNSSSSSFLFNESEIKENCYYTTIVCQIAKYSEGSVLIKTPENIRNMFEETPLLKEKDVDVTLERLGEPIIMFSLEDYTLECKILSELARELNSGVILYEHR